MVMALPSTDFEKRAFMSVSLAVLAKAARSSADLARSSAFADFFMTFSVGSLRCIEQRKVSLYAKLGLVVRLTRDHARAQWQLESLATKGLTRLIFRDTGELKDHRAGVDMLHPVIDFTFARTHS